MSNYGFIFFTRLPGKQLDFNLWHKVCVCACVCVCAYMCACVSFVSVIFKEHGVDCDRSL